MLTEDERERLEDIELACYALTGKSINLVSLCESWLASDNPALQAIARCIASGNDAAISTLNEALADIQPEVMTAALLTMRGWLYEQKDEPEAAFADYTAALQDVPPGEAREAVLGARRRVAFVAN